MALLLIIFACVGGAVDTYTSHRFFPPKIHPPKWFARTFLVWWLIIYSMVLPFLMVFIASGYNPQIIKLTITFGLLASIFWDLIFSKLWSGEWVSESCETWFWVGGRNFGFSKEKIIWFHLFRIILFVVFYYIFFIKFV